MTERADRLHHDNAPAHSTALVQAFFLEKYHITQICQPPLQPRFRSLQTSGFFSKAKIAVEIEEICECDGQTVHKLSQRRLSADWLAPRESGCSRMHSKVSSDCLPRNIKATLSVLEIFKMAGHFPDSPRIALCYIVGDSPFGRSSCLHFLDNVMELQTYHIPDIQNLNYLCRKQNFTAHQNSSKYLHRNKQSLWNS